MHGNLWEGDLRKHSTYITIINILVGHLIVIAFFFFFAYSPPGLLSLLVYSHIYSYHTNCLQDLNFRGTSDEGSHLKSIPKWVIPVPNPRSCKDCRQLARLCFVSTGLMHICGPRQAMYVGTNMWRGVNGGEMFRNRYFFRGPSFFYMLKQRGFGRSLKDCLWRRAPVWAMLVEFYFLCDALGNHSKSSLFFFRH